MMFLAEAYIETVKLSSVQSFFFIIVIIWDKWVAVVLLLDGVESYEVVGWSVWAGSTSSMLEAGEGWLEFGLERTY